MTASVREDWDLDAIFPGGSQSTAFSDFLAGLQTEVTACRKLLDQTTGPTTAAALPAFVALLVRIYQAGLGLMEAEGYTTCLTLQDLQDEHSRLLKSRREQLQAAHGASVALLDARLLQVPTELWPQLLAEPQVAPFAFALEQRRAQASGKLPPEQEAAIKVLAADGHTGWSDVFHVTMGRLRLDLEIDGQTRTLSLGQAAQRSQRSPDRALRAEVYTKTKALQEQEAPMLATALNHLAGYRLAVYGLRGWESVVQEPLEHNLMTAGSLQAMWAAVAQRRDVFLAYHQRKARLLGQESLMPYDLMAPVGTAARKLTYAEAVSSAVENLTAFHPALGEFAAKAIAGGWVDAQEGARRQPGINMSLVFPHSQAVRVFINAKDSPPIIAHELGHAHGDQEIFGAPAYAGLLPLSFALLEIPSTFFQLVVGRGMIDQAESRAERIAALAEQALQTTSMVASRWSQYLMEKAVYEQRKQGPLSVETLGALQVESMQQVFGDALAECNPLSWTLNLYLFMPEWPFYNFPYTVSYLLSAALYEQARQEGPAFAARYQQLLRDIGTTTVEELARKHLGADLSQPAFWLGALDVLLADIHEFLRLTDETP